MERFLRGESVPPLGRHAWRYHAEVAVEYGSDEAAEPEVVTDISLEGASIRTELDVDVGERVPLRLTAPLCDPIEVAGEVRWRRNGGDPALGMHFSFPGSVERRRMRELIAGIRDAIAGSTEMPVTLQ
jgi:hypothetical protein